VLLLTGEEDSDDDGAEAPGGPDGPGAPCGPGGSKLVGYNARFSIIFEMIDPRFYHNSSQSVNLTGASQVHASVTEYPTFPTFSLTLSSAAQVIQLNRTSPTDENGNAMNVRIDPTKTLDGAAGGVGDVITFNMATGRAYKNGTLREDWAVPGYMAYWPILPGNNTLILSSSATFSAKTMSYKRAFA